MQLVLEGKVDSAGAWGQYKSQAEQFICSCIQKGNNNVKKTPGGLLWFLPWNNLQYTSTAVFVANAYSEYLNAKVASIQCPSGIVQPSDLNYCLGRITGINTTILTWVTSINKYYVCAYTRIDNLSFVLRSYHLSSAYHTYNNNTTFLLVRRYQNLVHVELLCFCLF